MMIAGLATPAAHAQTDVRIAGDRLSGFVLPVEPLVGDIEMTALVADAWTVDDTKRLLLRGDVRIVIGTYRFQADEAAVWINRIPSADGIINQIALYFDTTTNPARRAGLAADGRDLLVTGSTRGQIIVDVAQFNQKRAGDRPIVRRGRDRLQKYLQRVATGRVELNSRPRVMREEDTPTFRPEPGGVVTDDDLQLLTSIALPDAETAPPWLRDPEAMLRFAAEHVEYTPGATEDIIAASGSLAIIYRSRDRGDAWNELSLAAERAVIFVKPNSSDSATTGEMSAESVRGIYLEGNVIVTANSDEYTVRAPQMYYDFETGQAIMVDAILRTYMRDVGIPVHARAQEMRQVAEDQWTANAVGVSTSEFFTPHFSIGAERMTLTRRPSQKDPADTELHMQSDGNVFRAGNLPLFGWPRFSGTLRNTPLRAIVSGTRDNVGLEIGTRWDLFGLMGVEASDTVDAELALDAFTARGAGAGIKFTYDDLHGAGVVDLYGLWDTGIDRTDAGREVDPDRDVRGIALWEHRKRFGRYWNLQAQTSFISDETFIPQWRDEDFYKHREYETSLYLKHQKGNSAFTMLGKYDINGFLTNDYLIASRQRSVDRLPEFSLRNYGTSWYDGALTYSQETRASYMRFGLEENSPNQLGVRSLGFGIMPTTPIAQALIDQGYDEDWVGRFDTRHELALTQNWGIFKVVPFLVGRMTAYSDDFNTFSSDSDSTRIHASGGVHISTQFQHINNDAESRLFNVHRIRHLVEPSVTLWYGQANVDENQLPTYDESVESIATGGAIRAGVRNTWQTQRGGPGRWHSVDVFTLDTDVILATSDTNRESPTVQFFDYRPEYSQLGNAFRTAGVWQMSDAVALAGEAVYDFDGEMVARGAIGAQMNHSPRLRSYIEYRFIDASQNELLTMNWDYELTKTYRINFRPEWDLREDEFRALRLGVDRRFPDFVLRLAVRFDQIRDDTQFSATMALVQF